MRCRRVARISFQIVAGRRVLRHPAMRDRHYVLDKLLKFHVGHQTAPATMLADLRAAAGQRPPGERLAEAVPLAEPLARLGGHRRRGPRPLGEILPQVLAELHLGRIQSSGSGAPGPT